MSPALVHGKIGIAIGIAFTTIHTGDIVIFQHPQKEQILLKRVVAIRKHAYFVKGDNTVCSTDSREFGWVKKETIFAKVIYPKTRYNM